MIKRDVYCVNCDVKMDILKEGFKIVSIKDLIGFECSDDTNPDKLIEGIWVVLATCPKCGYQGLIDLGEAWLTKEEVKNAISKRIIFSDNPEINVIFRLLA